jgi:tetratricopeptide (TPR) repeat protein
MMRSVAVNQYRSALSSALSPVFSLAFSLVFSLGLVPAALGKSPVPALRNEPTAGQAGERHRASTVLNQHGLPAEELSYLIDCRKSAEARMLLQNTAKHPGDEEERKWWIAACLCREQRFEESLEQFEQIKSLQQAPKQVLLMAVTAYAEDQQYKKAIGIANSILAKENNLKAYELRAGCFASSGNLMQASRDYEKCANLDPSSSWRFLTKAAMMLNKTQKSEQGLALLDRAIKTPGGKASPNVYLAQADCYMTLNHWQEAVVSLTEAVKLSKSYRENAKKGGNYLLPICYKERAICYEKLGNKVLAQADLAALDSYSRGIAKEIGAD